jgi:surface antigen
LIASDIIKPSSSKNKNNMKHRSKKISFSKLTNRTGRIGLTVLLTGVLMIGIAPRIVHAVSCSSASSCESQISSLNSQSANDKALASSLSSQDESYEATINSLDSQISSLQGQISSNEAKQATLNQEIIANQAEITQKKSILSDDIKTMYVDGQMTTIEELATSQNLSDFVDKQQYQSVVQGQLASIIQQINALESSLQSQKAQVAGLVSTEQSQNTQLASSQAQAQSLLNYNQSQQAAYNSQISAAASNVSSLEAQLSALNSAGTTSEIEGGTCGGGYPTQTPSSTSPGTNWGCDEAQDNTTDNWDMDNRECVSYTAFMVAKEYGISTKGWGNAYQWIAAAENAGFTVDQTPSVGAIAIRDRDYSVAGDVGHAMYVTAVNGSDSITVDEYNEHYNGTFDERTFSPSSYADRGGLYYIHFN